MIKRQSVEELLGLDKFAVDEGNPHIVLNQKLCNGCKEKPCLLICPAGLYTQKETGEIAFDYAGCLECGTCRILCADQGIEKWEYPRGGRGIAFRYG